MWGEDRPGLVEKAQMRKHIVRCHSKERKKTGRSLHLHPLACCVNSFWETDFSVPKQRPLTKSGERLGWVHERWVGIRCKAQDLVGHRKELKFIQQ
jgi:hypothetical protein